MREVRRSRALAVRAVVALAFGAAGALVTALFMSQGAPLPMVLALFLGSMLTFVAAAGRVSRAMRDNTMASLVEQPCSADQDAIFIGERRIERTRIRSASVVPAGDEAEIELTLDRAFLPGIRLRVPDVAAGDAVLENLGLGVQHQRSTFHTAAPFRVEHTLLVLLATLAAVGASIAWLPTAAVPLAALGLVVPMLTMTLPQRVVVGADGVHIRWAWRTRFVRHDEIAAIREERRFGERSFVMDLTDGASVLLPLGASNTPDTMATLRARIEAARHHHAKGEIAEAASALSRDGRDVTSWLARLRSLTQLGQHRKTAIIEPTLWSVLESPASPPVARAAAAVALRPRIDAAGTHRIAEVARATALGPLRIALETDDDIALADALDELEAEHERSATGE